VKINRRGGRGIKESHRIAGFIDRRKLERSRSYRQGVSSVGRERLRSGWHGEHQRNPAILDRLESLVIAIRGVPRERKDI